MRKTFLALALAVFGAGLAAQPAPPAPADRYAEGQVWSYRTRPGEEGSLLKIQRIDSGADLAERVYHISIVGVRVAGMSEPTGLRHLPVSHASLDSSVERPGPVDTPFPSAEEGIAIWRESPGAGVFTIPVAEIVETVDRSLAPPR